MLNSQKDDCPAFGVCEDTYDESFIPFHDSMQTSLSFRKPSERKPLQALHPSQASFGVYENTCEESSFIPFHDSMQASSCENPSAQDQNPRQYCAPLGIPIAHSHQALCEQTFTQFDIAHPKDTDSVSTPKTFAQHRGTYPCYSDACS